MKYLLLILTFVSLSAGAQNPTKRIGPTRIDSFYAKLQYVGSSDTTGYKPALMHVATGSFVAGDWVGGSGGGGGITGSGTTNYVPKWSSGSALGNSALYQDGGSLVMGSTTGEGAFRILSSGNGNNYMVLENSSSGSSAQSNFAVKSNTGDYTLFGTYNSGTTSTGVHTSGSGQIMTTATRLAFSANNASGEIMFGAGTNAPQRMAIGTGGVTINSSSNAYTLPTVRPGTNGYVLTGNTDGTTSWAAGGGGGGGTVSGTTNQIAKFTSSSAVGDGLLTDNGTRVGISPTEGIFHLKQGVAGNMYLLIENTTANAAAQASIGLKNDQGQYFLLSAYSSTTTASGIFAAGAANIYSGLTNGLAIGAASGPIVFAANGSSEVARLTSSGLRIASLAGSGSGYVAVDNSGNLSWSAGSGGGGGGTDFYTTDGTLTGTRTVSGASNTLNLGATGSKLSNLVFNVTNKVLVADGAMQYNVYSTSDANFSFDGMANFVEMVTSITANRTLTMPSASGQGNGTVVKIILPFSANSFHWSLNAGITDIKTGSTFTQLEWGTTYEFYVTGALTWLLIDKY